VVLPAFTFGTAEAQSRACTYTYTSADQKKGYRC